MVGIRLQTAAAAIGALEQVEYIQRNIRLRAAGQHSFDKHAWRKLEERPCRLKETIQTGE